MESTVAKSVVSMNLWENLIDQVKDNFFQYVADGHAFLINNVLQSFFFMMAIIELITWMLHKLNVFFAGRFNRSNNILKAVIFLLFFYVKIWTTYSAHLEILGYFCSVSICIHLYEGCVRLGTHFCQRYSKNSFGNISSVISIILIFLSYKVFRLSQIEQKETKYPYVALYFLMFGLILTVSLIKKKQFIYVLILTSMMGLIIMLRYWSLEFLKETFLSKASLPLECMIYLPLALQQNYNSKLENNQLKKLKGEQSEGREKIKPSDIMWAEVFYYVFFLINKRMYNIEIVFGSICVLSYILKKIE